MTEQEYKDLMQLFASMRSQGWDPQLCDTPVPYYDNRVPCGLPCGAGDIEQGEYIMLPRSVAELEPIYTLTVRGNSMKDAGISPGDSLEVLATDRVEDGDIVVATVDGEYTVKAFVTDDEGQHWLVPRNSDYRPMLLTEDSNAHILGRVVSIRKVARRASYSALMREVHKEKARVVQESMPQAKQYSTERLREVLHEAYEGEMASSRDWIAAYRVLVDKCGAPSSYTAFAEWVNAAAPEGFPLCTPDALRKADPVYLRPLYEWTPDMAPGVRLSVLDKRAGIAKTLRNLL